MLILDLCPLVLHVGVERVHLLQDEANGVLTDHSDVALELVDLGISLCQFSQQLRVLYRESVTGLVGVVCVCVCVCVCCCGGGGGGGVCVCVCVLSLQFLLSEVFLSVRCHHHSTVQDHWGGLGLKHDLCPLLR